MEVSLISSQNKVIDDSVPQCGVIDSRADVGGLNGE